MKRFLALKIWIGIEIAAVLVIAVLVILKTLVFEEEKTGPTYVVPSTDTAQTDLNDITLPRDLTVDEDESDPANAPGSMEATDETLEETRFTMTFPEEVTAKLSETDLRGKALALLITSPEALCGRSKVTVAGNVFQEAYAGSPVAGLIFRKANFVTPGSGMEMFIKFRGWARETTGYTLLLGSADEAQDAVLSERGFNLLTIPADTDPSIVAQANMIPVYEASFEEVGEANLTRPAVVATDDAAAVIAALNEGKCFFVRTDQVSAMTDAIVAAAESGDLLPEALDQGAGYSLSVRMALSAMRPEESEQEPPKATPAKTTGNSKKKKKELTPEEAALQQLAEQIQAAQQQTPAQ